MKFKKFLKISAILLFCIIIPLKTEAVFLYLEPSEEKVQPGQTFIVKIKIDNEEECINTVSVNLNYDKYFLDVVDFFQGESIVTLWLNPPEIDKEKGEISFSGGIPGGYCGKIPGDPGETDILGKIIFRVPGMILEQEEDNIAEVVFSENSEALLNDGFGTKADINFKGAELEVLKESYSGPDIWKEEISKDNIPPEEFEILISNNPEIFGGKYFIIFQTQDKQTGIDYYEVKEGEYTWKEAESPYLLEDQDLKSIIKVKAIDRAGNERISENFPFQKKSLFWQVILFLITPVFIAMILFLLIRLRKRK